MFASMRVLHPALLRTEHAILTPLLLVISMITGDFLAMLAATDNVSLSPTPNVWRVGSLTAAGVILGFFDLLFSMEQLPSAGIRWVLALMP
jgi:H+-transporting ATPase